MTAARIGEYDTQAQAWADKYNVRMEIKYTGHRKYFPDDTDTRDTYQITLRRHFVKGDGSTGRTMTFAFGASLVDSCHENTSSGPYWSKRQRDIDSGRINSWRAPNRKRIVPTLYTILASIEKGEPESFDDWCSSFGYDTDSRKALETYLACQKQLADFHALCNNDPEMIREAQDIN